MGEFIKTQNSFAHGEVAPEFYARDDINGLSRLQNMDVLAGGGLRRRRGLQYLTDLPRSGRLIPFSAGSGQDYIIHLSGEHMNIYATSGVRVRSMPAPWAADAIARVQFAQRFGSMIFVHPDYPPYVLSRIDDSFELKLFAFEGDKSNTNSCVPFMRFEDSDDVNITISKSSKGTNFAVFTTNRDFWTPENVNGRLKVQGQQWLVDEYVSPTSIIVITNTTFSIPSTAVSDWQEAAFSPRRGWPCSITFHQDRLVFGGSRSWPGGVWLSQVGRHYNFDIGEGLDDQAIFITLLSQKRQEICTVVSSDNLQILTTDGEWAISNKPLTPAAVDIKQHTSVGSSATRYLPPQKIEGQTVFISGSLHDIRELSLDELGEKYNATDLCALAKHLMTSPVDIAYNEATRQLFVVMADGNMAVLNQNSALGISAWGRYKTDGQFGAVVVCRGETFVMVARDGTFYLEKFSDGLMRDADNRDFEFCASAMPLRSGGHNAARIRIRRTTVRVLDTKSLFINGMRAVLPNSIYSDGAQGYSGDVWVSQLGTHGTELSVPWTIHGADAMPVQILSVSIHGRYGV